MAAVRTFYEVLNVSPDAEAVVIEAAYRALMKKYHPDQGGGAADGPSATEINRAYAVLRDAGRRAEYDQAEWIRQRDIQLAAYRPPPAPPRRSNFFAWGGWLVSLVLVGMIAFLASRAQPPEISAAEQARAAAMAEINLGSQPLSGGQSVVTPAERADIRAAALAAKPKEPEAKPAAPSPSADPAPVPAAATPRPADPAPAPSAARPVHRRIAPPHRAPPRRTPAQRRAEKDFLERQGYIY